MTDINNMSDEELIGYCEFHCETELALFKGSDINRMLALAGHPDNFVKSVPENEFIGMHDSMAYLCKLARSRLKTC